MNAYLWTSLAINSISMVSYFVGLMLNRYPSTTTRSVRAAVFGLLLTIGFVAWTVWLLVGGAK